MINIEIPQELNIWEEGRDKRFLAIKTRVDSPTRPEMEKLALAFSAEAADPIALEASVASYFSLSAPDVETFLGLVRKQSIRIAADAGADSLLVERLRREEGSIAAAVTELNRRSLAKAKMPFQLATLHQQQADLDAVLADSSLRSLFLQPVAQRCPTEAFPRYVGPKLFNWPWQVQLGNNQQTVSRVQDPQCNWKHEFPQPVQKWVSNSPIVWGIVYANAWGGNLAANEHAFFIKWWTLAPFAFLPFPLFLLLRAKK